LCAEGDIDKHELSIVVPDDLREGYKTQGPMRKIADILGLEWGHYFQMHAFGDWLYPWLIYFDHDKNARDFRSTSDGLTAWGNRIIYSHDEKMLRALNVWDI